MRCAGRDRKAVTLSATSPRLAKIAPLPNWSRRVDDPIPVQNGKPLFTLREAATYITALPKAEQQAPQWQLAAEMLLFVAERGGDPMLPRIAVMKALHHREPQTALPERRRRAKRYTLIG
jgi:hypothetical protein